MGQEARQGSRQTCDRQTIPRLFSTMIAGVAGKRTTGLSGYAFCTAFGLNTQVWQSWTTPLVGAARSTPHPSSRLEADAMKLRRQMARSRPRCLLASTNAATLHASHVLLSCNSRLADQGVGKARKAIPYHIAADRKRSEPLAGSFCKGFDSDPCLAFSGVSDRLVPPGDAA